MKIKLKESVLRRLISESVRKAIKEDQELNQIHDNGIEHFINTVGRFIQQYKNCLGTKREKSAEINLELQLTTNPDYTIKKIINEYGIKLKTPEDIRIFAFEIFPRIENDYTNHQQKESVNERTDYESNKMMLNFNNKFGKVGAHLGDFKRFISIYDANPDDFNKVNYDLFSMINGFNDGRTQEMSNELANKFGIQLLFNGTGKINGFNENTYKEIVEKIRNYCIEAQLELDKIQDYEKSID